MSGGWHARGAARRALSLDTVRPSWTFLTNHAHVLICIAADPDARLRDIADQVGITERAAQLIVADLVEAGYLTRTRQGRRNHYQIHPDRPLRHPLEWHRQVGDLLRALGLGRRSYQRAPRPNR
ncbi:MAG: winged helix-turn-helix domain-containing protein [Acidimicrobiales bacterium]|nr:winged helix-turn-helix domain-containing protein [Acidimicrobiales bacterium]